MQRPKEMTKRLQNRSFCCSSCRLSVSSEESESSNNSEKYRTISSIAHAMVQERLDQMIKERRDANKKKEVIGRSRRERDTKFVVMVAMEKSSRDPKEDFRESIVEMIVSNKIREAKDLRRLLDYYLTMNSDQFRGIILEVFHDVCTDLFVYCKRH
ncbi:hypothetical protein CASFOL_031708 [Castilleja foliolosa]|uniref:Transcription repressor n=1 Tax=Castilleja foliolosa TaxID=1961234 RepID=A0ABD3C5G4_9LAMI